MCYRLRVDELFESLVLIAERDLLREVGGDHV
jgi:hypothetical protein